MSAAPAAMAATLNVSTAVAFVVAACGVPVAKHGNRSMSSQTGAADVLEALGFRVELEPAAAEDCLAETGFCFLFAPHYHTAMKHVAPVRRELFIGRINRLRALDPSNPQATYAASPDFVPSRQDLEMVQAAVEGATQAVAARAAAHAYEEHVVIRREFPGVGSQLELQLIAQDVIRRNPPQFARDGRRLFYDKSTNTLVVVNTVEPENTSIFVS